MKSSPGRGSFLGSVVVHALILVLAWGTQAAAPAAQHYLVYEIELVSATAALEGRIPSTEELVVEAPEPAPEPAAELPPPEEAERTEEPAPTRETRPAPEPAEREPTEEPGTPDPEPEANRSGEDMSVRLEGLRRDFPAYYENVIRQINRCFRWRGEGGLRATVRFTIRDDGSVSDLRVHRGSGSFTFDLEAMGAIECAGRGRFGALPEEFPWDLLPVEFTFNPRREGEETTP